MEVKFHRTVQNTKYYTVETRNFEVTWFDIPVASMSF